MLIWDVIYRIGAVVCTYILLLLLRHLEEKKETRKAAATAAAAAANINLITGPELAKKFTY